LKSSSFTALYLSFLLFQISKAFPTAIFHGMGDQCSNSGMKEIENIIQKGTSDHAECIEIGNGAVTSLFTNFQSQASEACQSLKNNSHFQGNFNVIGFSQGALIARYMAETCFHGENRVKNILSIGGPNMGVQTIPHCSKGTVCQVINWIVRKFVYFPFIQNTFGPAGYFRHPSEYETYLKHSVFLPDLNNESNHTSFTSSPTHSLNTIQNMMLVMFSEDTMLFPKETAWFQQMNAEGDLLPLNSTKFYQSDYIGLKSLDEAGRVKYVKIKGDHLQLTLSDFSEIFIPFLNQ